MKKISLAKIVKEYIIESDGSTSLDQSFPRYMQIALSGLRELNTDVNGVEKETTLIVSDNYTAELPCDYLDYVGIGFCEGGRLTSMALNKNLCDTKTQELLCSCEAEAAPLVQDDFIASFDYVGTHFNKSGQFIGKYFGLGGGINSNGQYKIINNEYIVFNSVAPQSEVKLRYLATVDQVNGDYLVHPFEVEALKAWIYFKKTQRARNYSLGEKDYAKREYIKQKRMANNRHYELNLFELTNAFASGYKSSPKL